MIVMGRKGKSNEPHSASSKSTPRRSQLLFAVLGMVGIGVVVFVVLWFIVAGVVNSSWPWELASEGTTRASILSPVLAVVAGMGGIAYLTIAYRKQSDSEALSFMNRLENAARQLSSFDPTVQFAGIYALEALADESEEDRKQLCIDVLCGYLRLPYQGNGEPSLLREVVEKRTWTFERGNVEEIRSHILRPADREVRLTIIRTITKHLQEHSPNSWSNLNLDFTGVLFDGGDFSGAVFSGKSVSFSGASFTGTEVTFKNAVFSSENLDFRLSEFRGERIDFTGATFIGGMTYFQRATFSRGNAIFTAAKFLEKGTVSFRYANFSGRLVDFSSAEFSGGTLNFEEAVFSRVMMDFSDSVFSGSLLLFTWARIEGMWLNFHGSTFSGGELKFSNTEMSHGYLSFNDTIFEENGKVSFRRSNFVGTKVTFKDVVLGGGSLDFTNPQSWEVPPMVPWKEGKPPIGVTPEEWPPTVATTDPPK